MTDDGKFGGTQLAELQSVGKTQSPAASQYFICENHAINTIVIFIVDQANKLFSFIK
jgi:hypothetical protein